MSSIFVNNSLNGTKIGQVRWSDCFHWSILLSAINFMTLDSWSDIPEFGCICGIQFCFQSWGEPDNSWYTILAADNDGEFAFEFVHLKESLFLSNAISYIFPVWSEHLWTSPLDHICYKIILHHISNQLYLLEHSDNKILKWLSCVWRPIEDSCLLTCIIYFLQETSLLLGNLIDVLEEVNLATMELLNLTSAGFVLESKTCVFSLFYSCTFLS